MRAKRFLSPVVVACYLLHSYPILAGGGRVQTVAVIELSSPESSSVLTQRMADRLHEALKDHGAWRLLSRRETSSGLSSLGREAVSEDSLVQVVENASDHYQRVELEPAESSLRRKLDQIKARGEISYEENLSLLSAYLLLGVIQNANGESDRASRTFEEAVRLRPDMEMSEREYSPTVRRLFQQAKQKVLSGEQEFGEIKVDSSPRKVKVYLNGSFKGESPLSIRGVPPGRHHLALVKGGYATRSSLVNLSSHGSVKVSLDLEKSDQKETVIKTKQTILHVTGPDDRSGILREATLAGQWLNADRVVLVHAEEKGGAGWVTTYWVDLSNPTIFPTLFPHKTVEIAKGGEEAREISVAVATLTSFLTEGDQAIAEGTTEPPLRMQTPRKSFWKKPLFWVIGGLLVAGAGAGAGIALSSGGGGGGAPTTSISVDTPVPGGLTR